jgi:hypothetical protein
LFRVGQWHFTAFVPGYGGGSATELHRLPYQGPEATFKEDFIHSIELKSSILVQKAAPGYHKFQLFGQGNTACIPANPQFMTSNKTGIMELDDFSKKTQILLYSPV